MKVFMRVENMNVKVHANMVQLTLKLILSHSFFFCMVQIVLYLYWPLTLIKILFSLLINFCEANTAFTLYKGT